MKEMGYDEGEEEGEEVEDDDPAGPSEPAPAPPVPTGGNGSKRAQVQPAATHQRSDAPGGGGAGAGPSGGASQQRGFQANAYRGEPPDFEPPPSKKSFAVEEEGAGMKTQIAIVAVRCRCAPCHPMRDVPLRAWCRMPGYSCTRPLPPLLLPDRALRRAAGRLSSWC